MSFNPIHQHLIVSSVCEDPPQTCEEVETFLRDLVETVGMKVVAGPMSAMVSEEGNEGPTGAVVLATSHAAVHSWTVNGRVEWDLYSCCKFDPNRALYLFASRFNPSELDWKLIDRNNLRDTTNED